MQLLAHFSLSFFSFQVNLRDTIFLSLCSSLKLTPFNFFFFVFLSLFLAFSRALIYNFPPPFFLIYASRREGAYARNPGYSVLLTSIFRQQALLQVFFFAYLDALLPFLFPSFPLLFFCVLFWKKNVNTHPSYWKKRLVVQIFQFTARAPCSSISAFSNQSELSRLLPSLFFPLAVMLFLYLKKTSFSQLD